MLITALFFTRNDLLTYFEFVYRLRKNVFLYLRKRY